MLSTAHRGLKLIRSSSNHRVLILSQILQLMRGKQPFEHLPISLRIDADQVQLFYSNHTIIERTDDKQPYDDVEENVVRYV